MTALPGYVEPRGRWAPSPDPTRGGGSAWPHAPRGLCVHYVGAKGNLLLPTHDDCHRAYSSILRYTLARTDFDYSDIEYNVGACPHGILTELRGLDHEGAAQLNANADYVSALALLNVGDVLTANMAHALYLARLAVMGRWSGATALIGHNQAAGNPSGTSCPGPSVSAWIARGGQDPFGPGGGPAPAPAPPPPSSSSHPTIRRGSTGAAVREAQIRLNAKVGKPHLVVDGVFGPMTEAATRQFQSNVRAFFHLPTFAVDGIIGPATWYWLGQ